MNINPHRDDASDFVSQVELMARGVLHRHAPETLILIKTDNWFGPKWLGFSGKVLGALGVWSGGESIVVPPFVPNRIVSQRGFIAPTYQEIEGGQPVHRHIKSCWGANRKVRTLLPSGAFLWYSGNSKVAGRGAVMAYVPEGDCYWNWYVALQKGSPWRVNMTRGAKRKDVSDLVEQGSKPGPWCSGA